MGGRSHLWRLVTAGVSCALLAGCSGSEGDPLAPGPISDESPRLAGALFVGVTSPAPSQGDVVVLRFNRNVILRRDGLEGFEFARSTDSFGQGAFIEQSVPGGNQVELVLGTGPVLVPGAPGDLGLTAINLAYSGAGVVGVQGVNGFRAAHADIDVPLREGTTSPPELLRARLVDADNDGAVGAGDLVIASFDKPIVVPPASTVGGNFELPVAGDSFGAGAALSAASPSPVNRAAIVTLGDGAVITPSGLFDASATAAGSPSALRVAAGSTITDTVTGSATAALAGVTVDVSRRLGGPPGNGRSSAGTLDASGASALNHPTGVLLAAGRLVIGDTDNNRVLVYNTFPAASDAPADVVLGQADGSSTDPDRGGTPTAATLDAPTYVATDGMRLVVADTGNNRVLVWNAIPSATGAPADVILGQPAADTDLPNAGGAPGARTFNAPRGVAAAGDSLVVADTGNNRVLIFSGLSALAAFQPARTVLGQPTFTTVAPNQGLGVSRSSLKSPEAVLFAAGHLYVADTANNRVLVWTGLPFWGDELPSGLLGQVSFTSASVAPARPETLLAPAGIALNRAATALVVADTGHHRVLFYQDIEADIPSAQSANGVTGQTDLQAGEPNAGQGAPGPATLWSPRGVYWDGYDLLVADSDNNRIGLFR